MDFFYKDRNTKKKYYENYAVKNIQKKIGKKNSKIEIREWNGPIVELSIFF